MCVEAQVIIMLRFLFYYVSFLYFWCADIFADSWVTLTIVPLQCHMGAGGMFYDSSLTLNTNNCQHQLFILLSASSSSPWASPTAHYNVIRVDTKQPLGHGPEIMFCVIRSIMMSILNTDQPPALSSEWLEKNRKELGLTIENLWNNPNHNPPQIILTIILMRLIIPRSEKQNKGKEAGGLNVLTRLRTGITNGAAHYKRPPQMWTMKTMMWRWWRWFWWGW